MTRMNRDELWLRCRILQMQYQLDHPEDGVQPERVWEGELIQYPPPTAYLDGRREPFPEPDTSGKCNAWNLDVDDAWTVALRCMLGRYHPGEHANLRYVPYNGYSIVCWEDTDCEKRPRVQPLWVKP